MCAARLALLMVLTAFACFASSPEVQAEGTVTTGSLALNAVISIEFAPEPCPPSYDTRGRNECFAVAGTGTVSGLGKVSVSYMYVGDNSPPDCPFPGYVRGLGADVRFVVSGKGELAIRTAPSGCLSLAAGEQLSPARREFTVTAGTGIYAGVSGGGAVTRKLGPTIPARGDETWEGTLVVAGLDFDVVPPTLSGAAAKTVRVPKKAKTAQVTFEVTVTDDVDGPLPASCQPKSGSRFKVGKTTVRCEATDSSGNTGKAAFTVTVKRRR